MKGLALFAALLAAACVKERKQAAGHHEANLLQASVFSFDGLRLGDDYAKVKRQPGWAEPCDIDKREDGKVAAVVYPAAACKSTFSHGTSVMLYADAAPEGAGPLRVIAWLGGDYFSARSTFPVHVGASEDEATELLGHPALSFELESDVGRLTVHKHPHGLYSLIDRGVAVGFVAGENPGRVRQRTLGGSGQAVLQEHSVARGRARGRRRPARLRTAVLHTLDLYAHDPAFASSLHALQMRGPTEIEACVGRGTKHRVACLLAASDTKAMNACEP